MDKVVLEALLKQGMSTHKIAANLNKSQSNVMYWIRKHGLSVSKRKQDIRSCKYCGVDVIKTSSNTGKYCSTKCQAEHAKAVRISEWLAGMYTERPQHTPEWIRNYMLEKSNCSCSICGWNKRHPVDGLPLVEIDHIDGDATNHDVSNLQVLCPNCHSETPTFRRRNKESTRKYRTAGRIS